jgi:hypothetical protein
MIRTALLSIALLALTGGAVADEVIKPGGPNGPAVSVDDFAWMAGRWVGEGLGGKVEEMFSPPAGGQMVGHFRSWDDKGPRFYEFECICVVGQTVEYRVKHFNPDFHGWEEKNDFHVFPLISVENGVYRFDGLTIQRISATEVHHIVSIKGKDGKVNEMTFIYRKVP